MKSKNILFADDDADLRNFMKEVFQEVSKGIKTDLIITEAKDGAEAIQLFDESIQKENPFDIVVTDYMMPVASGLQVIKHVIKTHPVPIIVISAYNKEDDIDFIKEGALIFISKPFTLEQINYALSDAVSFSLVEEDIEKAEKLIKILEKLTS
jgi:CheY-like chemotaxis protein